MGFHLAQRVYSYVRGTSASAQAILAYLALKADDATGARCYPSQQTIEAATHLKHSCINTSLNELREAGFLRWISGGRRKGEKGRAFANEYAFHIPIGPEKGTLRQTDNAVSVKRTKQYPPDGQCSIRQTDTINHSTSKDQPSVIVADGKPTAEERVSLEEEAKAWERERAAAKSSVEERRELFRQEKLSLVGEAMRVAGVTDMENRKIFSSTMLSRDSRDCFEVILQFESELQAGEHDQLVKPAALLNRRLAALPPRA